MRIVWFQFGKSSSSETSSTGFDGHSQDKPSMVVNVENQCKQSKATPQSRSTCSGRMSIITNKINTVTVPSKVELTRELCRTNLFDVNKELLIKLHRVDVSLTRNDKLPQENDVLESVSRRESAMLVKKGIF